MEYHYHVGNQIKTVRVEREGEAYRVSVDGAAPREVRVTREDEHTLRLQFDGQQQRLCIAHDGQKRFVALGSTVFELKLMDRASQRQRASAETNAGNLQAQMPGQVVSLAVHEGDEVTRGQTLVVLEAMKMELRVQAPYTGRVKRVLVEQGQVVERGQQLVEVVRS